MRERILRRCPVPSESGGVHDADGRWRAEDGKGWEKYLGGYFDDEISPALRHSARGIVSMANKGENTNGSQFFICYTPQKHLDGRNTVFGKVIDGMDTTLKRIEEVEVDKKHRPKTPVRIQKVTIHANPLADMDPGQ
ncbi:cyclophilin-like domain-containing protein [Trichophaea hybrida]|nr:cyclophilin-like domain-containing protein [Trichophaea hybrida]